MKDYDLKTDLVRNTKMPPKPKKEDGKKSDKKSEYVLTMTLDDSSILRRAITSFKDQLAHARLEFDESGMAVSGMHMSNIALINYKLHKNTNWQLFLAYSTCNCHCNNFVYSSHDLGTLAIKKGHITVSFSFH